MENRSRLGKEGKQIVNDEITKMSMDKKAEGDKLLLVQRVKHHICSANTRTVLFEGDHLSEHDSIPCNTELLQFMYKVVSGEVGRIVSRDP